MGRQTSWLFTSVAEELNLGLPRTTPATANHSAMLPLIINFRWHNHRLLEDFKRAGNEV